MGTVSRNRILAAIAIWLMILSGFACWFELDTRRQEKQLAMAIARAFFQQIMVSIQWNVLHDGVYVPITSKTLPNQYLPEQLRELTADNGIKLTRVNPALMIRQMAELAMENKGGARFHITSLNPIRPENTAVDWEEEFLLSFKQGAKEEGGFYREGQTTWFRYMAPLSFESKCLKCHEQAGGNKMDFQGGLSVSIPFITHSHFHLFVDYGLLAILGIIVIFIGVTFHERKQLLFDAIFNSPVPICVTDKDYTILMANKSYWSEFGPLPDRKKKIKCFEHRPGESCHTDRCPLFNILSGLNQYVCEPSKEKNGTFRHFIVTAEPLLDCKDRVIGIIESFQDITEKKRLEGEKELLLNELKESLKKVKLLSGLVPICASCKKIRDDRGFWSQVESYISKHSEAKFSHGICPDCAKKLYPDHYNDIWAKCGKVKS